MADKRNIVCIDSMICVWGIKKEANKDQLHMIPRAEAFLEWLDASNKTIMIPAPVIMEILIPVDDPQRVERIYNVIEKNFIIGDLDALAGVKAGQIINENKELWEEHYKKEGDEGLRNKIKVDSQILAIAITSKADVLYTFDKRLINLGSQYLRTEEMPDIPKQGKLFEENK